MLPNLLRRTLLTFLTGAALLGLAPSAPAADKHYNTTAADGVTLAVQETGNPDGPAIVFIHGLLGSRLNWEPQMRDPALLQRYRMITYDLRGHGLSGKPAGDTPYSDGRRWADDLASVLKASGAKRPVLVGWSLGGTVISNYLAAYGDAALGGALYVDGVIELKPELLVSHPAVYRDMLSDDLKTHLDAARTFLGLCFYTRPDAATFERLLQSAALVSWDMQRAVMSMTVQAAEGLPRARVPLLLIYGAHEALVQAAPSIARAKALNPRVQSKLYEHSGHAPFLEETARFNRDLSDFVDAAALKKD